MLCELLDVKLLLLGIDVLVASVFFKKLPVGFVHVVILLRIEGLVPLSAIHEGKVSCHWANSITEVDEIKSKVCECGKLWVELSLGNGEVVFGYLALRPVFENFHKADAVTV